MTTETTETIDDLILEAARAAVETLPTDDREEFMDYLVRALKTNKPPEWMTAGQQLAGWKLLAELYVWCDTSGIKGDEGGFACEFLRIGTQDALLVRLDATKLRDAPGRPERPAGRVFPVPSFSGAALWIDLPRDLQLAIVPLPEGT